MRPSSTADWDIILPAGDNGLFGIEADAQILRAAASEVKNPQKSFSMSTYTIGSVGQVNVATQVRISNGTIVFMVTQDYLILNYLLDWYEAVRTHTGSWMRHIDVYLNDRIDLPGPFALHPRKWHYKWVNAQLTEEPIVDMTGRPEVRYVSATFSVEDVVEEAV